MQYISQAAWYNKHKKVYKELLDNLYFPCDTKSIVRTNSKTKYIAQAIKKGLSIIQNETTNIDPVSLSQEQIAELILAGKLPDDYELDEEAEHPLETYFREKLQAAQNNDQAAIDKLCDIFQPLILKEAHHSNIYGALGEDAENVAWVIFLEIMHRYDKNSYRYFPGFVKTCLHFRLLDSLHQEGCLYDCVALDGGEDFADTLTDGVNKIDHKIASLSFDQVFRKLTKAQREVIESIDLDDMSVKNFSKLHNCTTQNTYKTRLSALTVLKKHLE